MPRTPTPHNGDHDVDIPSSETPNAIIRRLVGELRGIAVSLENAVHLLETLRGDQLKDLASALADECDELLAAARNLGPALRRLAD